VTSIEREGRPVPLKPTVPPLVPRAYLRAHLALVETRPRARMALAAALAPVQDLGPYRSAAGRWFARAKSDIRFTVRVPLNASLGDAAVREIEPQEFDPTATWDGRSVDRWTLAAIRQGSRVPVGEVTVTRGSNGEWHIDEPRVRLRYRGTGLEDMLVQKTRAVLDRSSR
jgi:hypothetical protein